MSRWRSFWAAEWNVVMAATATRQLDSGVDGTAGALIAPRVAGWETRGGVEAAEHDGSLSPAARRKIVATLVAVAVGIVGWAVVNLANGWVGFAAIVPLGFRGGGEAAISIARLFAAGVLVLIGAPSVDGRLRWVACGFVVLGLGQLIFGYLAPILETTTDLNESLYQMILVRTLAGALFVVGLVPREPPRFTSRTAIGIALLTGLCVAGYWILKELNAVPKLVLIESLEEAARLRIAPMSWLTGWHWVLAAIPFGLAAVAVVGADRQNQRGEIGGWLPLAILLLAGSELHDALWPSAYGNSIIFNTADLLRLAMAAVVVIGGALELRRIAAERAALLAAEKERFQRLEELTVLKADFTAMVAHELGHPLSAIRRLTEMLARDGLDPNRRQHALATILKETDALDVLVADMQATASVERDDFKAMLRPVEVGELVHDAVRFAESHAPQHPLETAVAGVEPRARVRADRGRIGQVLRNLLCNAAKHSPAGTPISLRAAPAGDGRIRIEVADRGPGIHPDDLTRIFEKFGRGRNGGDVPVPGVGMGLYLSRRIVRAHGSDISVRSRPGAGAVFAFELEGLPSAVKGNAR
jgi:signal transduction histidine kinase